MRDDGATIKNIKRMDNNEILKYTSGDNEKFRQQLSQALSASTIDRGGSGGQENDEKDENKENMNKDDNIMQENHNNPAKISSTISPITQPTKQDDEAMNAFQGGTNKEVDKNYEEDDDQDVLNQGTLGGPPRKKHKGNNY